MDYYQLVATVSLVVQIVVLVLLFGGYWLKRNEKVSPARNDDAHSRCAPHYNDIGLVMIPSFVSGFSALLFNEYLRCSLNCGDHCSRHSWELQQTVLGVWMVASWRLRAVMQTCFAKKKLMRVTLTYG